MSTINPKQEKFILLRADGISYDNIAKELHTAKSTLIQWSKLFQDQINELQFYNFIQIKEAYAFSKKAKYETLLQQLQKIDDGILSADISGASVKDLFTIKNNLVFQIEALEKRVKTKAHVTTTNEFGYTEELELQLNEAE